MSELQRQQQRRREIRELTYGKPKVVNVLKPKIVYIAPEQDPESEPPIEPDPLIEPEPEPQIEKRLTPFQFIKKMASLTKFSYEEIIGPRRSVDLVRERHRIIVAVKETYNNLSYPQIARLFNRDHTTIIHAVQKYEGKKEFFENEDLLADEMKEYAESRCADFGVNMEWLNMRHHHYGSFELHRIIMKETYHKFKPDNLRSLSIIFDRAYKVTKGIIGGRIK
jgi:hypothetical protein